MISYATYLENDAEIGEFWLWFYRVWVFMDCGLGSLLLLLHQDAVLSAREGLKLGTRCAIGDSRPVWIHSFIRE